MTLLRLLILGLLALPVAARAELKWDQTEQKTTWKPGETEKIAYFAYRNTGQGTQQIVSLRSACVCCTSSSASKKKLAPGEKGTVKVRVDLHGKTLPMVKAVTVTTDDGKSVALLLTIATPGGQTVEIPRQVYKR